MLLQRARSRPSTGICSSSSSQWLAYKQTTFLAIIVLIVLIILPLLATSNLDPYEVLGVSRDANSEQIKRAYRDLAKKFHPDKSSSIEDESGRRFIELNKAFNILKDPDRRNRYDQTGAVEENRHSRGYHHGEGGNVYQQHYQYNRRARESWSSGHNGFRTFTFYSSAGHDGYFRMKSITTKQYLNDYVKESKQRPFLIFFYTDFCPSCSRIESIWIKITEELGKYNVGSVTINVHSEPRLAHELGVSSIPQIACLLDGQLHHYYQSEISLASFVKFIKNSLPNNLVPLLKTDYDQDRHIAQTVSQHNRLSAIIIDDEKSIKLRYLLLVYSLRQYYRFGHISTKLCEHKTLSKQYNLLIGSKSHIIAFDENIKKPRLHIQYEPEKFAAPEFTRQLLEWPFLKLPKLSSQFKFDNLCLYSIPRDNGKVTTKLCVILFAPATSSSLHMRGKMLEFIELNGLGQDKKVVFAYLDPEKQSDFVNALIQESVSAQPKFVKESIESGVILIERNPSHSRKAHYQWISNRWLPNEPDQIDRAKLELHQQIIDYKRGLFELKKKILLNLLVDEEGPSLMDRIYSRFVGNIARMISYMTSRESFSAVIILVGCAILTSLFLYKSPVPSQFSGIGNDFQYYCPEPSASSHSKNGTQNGHSSFKPKENSHAESDMKIIELKAETYNGMVRLLKPGCRSIVLLADQESKDKLLTNFKKAVWPYRKNKTLLFGYICLDKNLNWYKTLLEHVLGCEDLNVNKKNCIGTVLSLNGFKKYFRVYHAKHHEIDYYDDDTDNDGSFLGFNDHNDGDLNFDMERGESTGSATNDVNNRSRNNTVYTVDTLLDKLPIWLDKMFDGLTKRYFLDEWPEEIK